MIGHFVITKTLGGKKKTEHIQIQNLNFFIYLDHDHTTIILAAFLVSTHNLKSKEKVYDLKKVL